MSPLPNWQDATDVGITQPLLNKRTSPWDSPESHIRQPSSVCVVLMMVVGVAVFCVCGLSVFEVWVLGLGFALGWVWVYGLLLRVLEPWGLIKCGA